MRKLRAREWWASAASQAANWRQLADLKVIIPSPHIGHQERWAHDLDHVISLALREWIQAEGAQP